MSEPIFERQTIVPVRLEPEEVEVVEAIAKSRGISHANLIQEWVVERIHASSGFAA